VGGQAVQTRASPAASRTLSLPSVGSTPSQIRPPCRRSTLTYLALRLLRWRSVDRISAAEALRLPAFVSEVPTHRLTTEVHALAISRALEPLRGCERVGGVGDGVRGRGGGASTAAISAKGAGEWKKEASSRIGSKERAKYALMTWHVHMH